MKTKMMKRAAAFAASVLMTAAMAVPVSASSNPDPVPERTQVSTQMSGKPKAFCGVDEISVPKKMYLFNPDSVNIYAPNIIYTYTLAAGEGGDKITGLAWDVEGKKVATPESNSTVTVKDGVLGAIKITGNTDTTGDTAELQYGKTDALFPTKPAETKGTDNFEVLNLKVEKGSTAFPGAGVYRYTLTESVNRASAGVVDGSGDDQAVTTRYLDVYVDANKNIYGYVLANEATGYIYDASAAEGSKKINELDPDFYHTQNYKITKKITGSMADKTHEFPVSITLSDGIGNAEIWGVGDSTNFGDVITNNTTDEVTVGNYGTQTYNLKDDEFVQIYGLPMNTKITIDEENNTNDNYTATLEQTNPTASKFSGKEVAAGAMLSATVEATLREFAFGQEQQSYEAELTNNLDAVSPTGLLFRVAPFALMMTAGGVLIAVYLRGKKREDAESMI